MAGGQSSGIGPSDGDQPSVSVRSSNVPSDGDQPSVSVRSSNVPSDDDQPSVSVRSSNVPSDGDQPCVSVPSPDESVIATAKEMRHTGMLTIGLHDF